MTRLPDDFVLGVSSSGHQIEGENDHSDWWAFEQRGLVAGGDRSGRAADWWNRYRDDVALMQQLGVRAHRFGVEWSRVEPAAGHFDDAALDRYADMVTVHRAAGIVPYIALSHFTIPQWIAERGGWLAPDFVERLIGYTERTVRRIGRDVACYFTLNEPLTLASMAYYFGLWPPQHRSLSEYCRVQRRTLEAHLGMARVIRSVAPGVPVGLIKAWSRFLPYRRWFAGDQAYAALTDWLFNGAYLSALCSERLPPPLGHWERLPGLRDSIDLYGLNYYLAFYGDSLHPSFPHPSTTGDRLNQLGWGEHPQGLLIALRRARRLGKPILITENGLATDDDAYRGEFIRRHVEVALQARGDGVDVRGYLYWSFLDNFEWAEGWRANFGLCGFDHTTLARQPRPSAYWFGRSSAARELLRYG